MGRVRVSVLGQFEVTCDGVPLVARGVKQRAVLALLAMQPGRAVPVHVLVKALWGEDVPESNNLQVYVTRWRRLFERAGAAARIDLQPAGYRLDIDPADVDAVEFERWVGVGRDALGRDKHAVAVHAFRQALTLVRGDPLQDFSGLPFHRAEHTRIEQLQIEMAAGRVEALLALGQGGELVADLEGLVVRYPYTERFWAQLMHALYRTGRQVESMRTFERARRTLADAGIEPGTTLRTMEKAVLAQAPELESKSSPFSPTPPPVPLTSLIGRKDEVAAAVEQIREGADRLFTATGPGGVGKTRFAIEVATRVAEEGWTPVAYVALSDVNDPLVVGSFVNGSFGVPDSWRERPVRDVARMLATSPLLLVIDGIEHLLDEMRSLVTDLLAVWPQLKVLLTSRRPVGIRGERQIPVPPLAARLPGGDAREAPAVALFLDRCERAGEVLALSDTEIDAVVAICERVDGLPLAIELAAARSRTLGVVGLHERLKARLDLVATPGRADLDRHGSLRRVIEWSYGLLDTQSRELLARLSVFAGGFTIDHVEQMWADLDAGQLLGSFEELDRNSLLARMPGTPMRRFRLLDTVAEFAREKLVEAGESDDAHRRLVAWLRDRIGRAGGLVGAGAVQFEPLEPEADNARAAAGWMLEHASPDDAAQFCTQLYVWWTACARGAELGRWLSQLSVNDIADPTTRGWVFLQHGRIEGRLDHVAESNVLLGEALELWRHLGSEEGVAQTLTSLVENLVHLGDFERAAPMAQEALNLAAHLQLPELSCRALHASCWLAGCTEQLEHARDLGTELAARSAAAGLWEFQAKTLADLAWIARLSGESHEAEQRGLEALSAAERAGSGGALVSAWTELELARLLLGRLPDAMSAAASALTCESGDDLSPSSVLRVVAPVVLIAEGLEKSELAQSATDLVDAVLRCLPFVGVWPADSPIVGELVDAARERVRRAPGTLTEIDVLRRSRQFGSILAGETAATAGGPGGDDVGG